MLTSRARLLLGSSILLAACGSSGAGASSSTAGTGGAGPATSSSSTASGGPGGGIGFDAGGGGKGGGPSCVPPDAMIALDRTLTMHKTPNGSEPKLTDAPDYASTKFYQAITAIEKLVAAPTDSTVRFGLELWPKESPGCVTLAEKIGGTQGTNPSCEDGEIVVPPALGTGATIAATLDPKTTKICLSTPTGQGLLTGAGWLTTNAVAGRGQYIILVTDGADWDQSCPTPDPVAVTQQLAGTGIKTFVVGFSAEGSLMAGGVGAGFLNDMACAGQTAPGFPAPCKMMGNGWVSSDPMGPALYLAAGDSAALTTALQSIAAAVCCNCVH